MSEAPAMPTPAAQAEAVHGGDHRNRAVVDRREGVVAAAVHGGDQAPVARQLLHVDAGAEAAPLRRDHDDAHGVDRGRARSRLRPGATSRRRAARSPADGSGRPPRSRPCVLTSTYMSSPVPPRAAARALPRERLERAFRLRHDTRDQLGAARKILDHAGDRAARQIAVHRVALGHRLARQHRRVGRHDRLRARELLAAPQRGGGAQQLARATRPSPDGRRARCAARARAAPARCSLRAASTSSLRTTRCGSPSIWRVTITSSTSAAR